MSLAKADRVTRTSAHLGLLLLVWMAEDYAQDPQGPLAEPRA